MHHSIQIRVGVPQTTGYLVRFAAQRRLPVLFSANAFARTNKDGEFAGFNLHHASNLPVHLDASLDSSGFVAAVRYGDYRWSPEEYMDLVASRRWTWYASLDYCCEPPVASAPVTRDLRIEATVRNYDRCASLAARRNLPAPMPVLQGWLPEHYERCARLHGFTEWPALVGLGSVCRRNVAGPDGIAAILERLDHILPAHVRIHGFGCKGAGLLAHARLASIDSMAWDYGVRAAHRTGRTQAMRARAMLRWFETQSAMRSRPTGPTPAEGRLTPVTLTERIHGVVADWYAAHLLAEHEYRETVWLAEKQAREIVLKVQAFGAAALLDSDDMVDQVVHEQLFASA